MPPPCVVYRHSDGTRHLDSLTGPWLGGNGYSLLRVDRRGTGNSLGGGYHGGEYTKREILDLFQVVVWAAEQPWCDGDVFLLGHSYSAILSLAAIGFPAEKRPIQLKVHGNIFLRYIHDLRLSCHEECM